MTKMTDISKAVERLKSTLHEGLNQNDWGISRDELRANDLAALIAFYDGLQWRPVEEAPKHGTTGLVYYKNLLGKCRIVRAFYVQQYSLERDDDYDEDDEDDDYDEDADQYYVAEGWYEIIDNCDEFYSTKITNGRPTHFIPLSAIPFPSY